ncbi:MAG: Hpt domain-containing protein [Azonexus sp.]|nr:Hpt domain-containing protein [Azonexus sp.]
MILIPQQLAHFDVADAVARMLDRPELWWQAVGLFVGHFEDWPSDWEAAIGDDVLERRRVHAIRSAAANVGATPLVLLAGQLESLLARRLAGEAVEIEPGLREQLQQVFAATWQTAAAAWQSSGGALAEAG